MRSALLLIAAVVGTQAAAQSPQSVPDPGERECRSQGQIGSRLGARRVCRTRAEWAELDRGTRTAVRDAQTRQLAPSVDWQPGKLNGSGPGGPR